jgi:hypothetical protein
MGALWESQVGAVMIDLESFAPGEDIASLAQALGDVGDQFNRREHLVRFPRTHLIGYLASLELTRPPRGDPFDALLVKLREYSDTEEIRLRTVATVLAAVLRAFPNPAAMIAEFIDGFVRRNFWLWLRGAPECRWLRRQRHLLPGRPFETFLLGLTAGPPGVGGQHRTVSAAAERQLAVQAFLDDLRAAYQPRLWRRRTWDAAGRRPVLVLDNLDDTLPALLSGARRQAMADDGHQPDPLLVVLVPRAERRERGERDFAPRVIRSVGDLGSVACPRLNRPWLARAEWLGAPLGATAVVTVLALAATGVLAFPGPADSRGPGASPRPTPVSPPRPPCSAAAGPDGETELASWKDDKKEIECVGFSDSYTFKNPSPPDSQQQRLQEVRMSYDQGKIYQADKDAGATAPQDGPGAFDIVYFAGLTESPLDEYDSAEAEEMEGMLAAQRDVQGNDEQPQLRVIIANGGAEMKAAKQVADMIIRKFGNGKDPHFLGVAGLDRSTGDVRSAIQDLNKAGIATLATTLSADGPTYGIVGNGTDPDYFQLSAANTAEAALMLRYVKEVVPLYFEQPASVYPSGGFIAAQRVVIFRPKASGPSDPDLYIESLAQDLVSEQRKDFPELPAPIVTDNVADPRLCGPATVDIYAGRHDLPLDAASPSKNDDFTQFLDTVLGCASQGKAEGMQHNMPFVIADDGVSRFIADPADRSKLASGATTISYVTKGINMLGTGMTCLSKTSAQREYTQPPLSDFCYQYAQIATALRARGVPLLWTGERVGLGYDAAQLFLQAALQYYRKGQVLTYQQVAHAFEAPATPFSLVTGSVDFARAPHVGIDKPQGMPLAVVRILIDREHPDAAPSCAFTGFNGAQLSSIPNLDRASSACADAGGAD